MWDIPLFGTEPADGGMHVTGIYSVCSAGDEDSCTAELDEDEILSLLSVRLKKGIWKISNLSG